MDITRSEKQDIYQALNIWADYIETGSVDGYDGERRDLTEEQVNKILDLRELSRKILN